MEKIAFENIIFIFSDQREKKREIKRCRGQPTYSVI